MENLFSSKIRTYLDCLAVSAKKPQSYIFSGTNGAGKGEAAFYFIAKISEKENDRVFFERIKGLNHPDVIVIEPGVEEKKGKTREKDISVEQIRQMQERLKFFPYELGKKFCVIKKANRMTNEAANSLLKFLEEPQADTFFILLVNSLDNLLPTIISRSAVLRFAQIDLPKWDENHRQDLRQIFVREIFERFEYAEKISKDKNGAVRVLEDWENLTGDSLRKLIKENDRKKTETLVLLLKNIRETINRIQSSNANPRTAIEKLVLGMEWR